MSEKTLVVGHFDTHGVTAAYLAARVFSSQDVYANFPQTSPENVVPTLKNLLGPEGGERRKIVMVDIPVDLKNTEAFVKGLDELGVRHNIHLIDHHETSLPHFSKFQRVQVSFHGSSALLLNSFLLSQIRDPKEVDFILAIAGAISDRDPEVLRRGLYNQELQAIADGLDVMVREKDGALNTLRRLLKEPEAVIREAKERAAAIPVARLKEKVGRVAVSEALPENWGAKALEKLAFREGAWYAVGPEYVTRDKQWVVRAIARWDVLAKNPNLPLPGTVMKALWPGKTIIGHPAAPVVAAADEREAREMATQLARAIAERVSGLAEQVRDAGTTYTPLNDIITQLRVVTAERFKS